MVTVVTAVLAMVMPAVVSSLSVYQLVCYPRSECSVQTQCPALASLTGNISHPAARRLDREAAAQRDCLRTACLSLLCGQPTVSADMPARLPPVNHKHAELLRNPPSHNSRHFHRCLSHQ